MESKLPFSVASVVRQGVRTYGNDTTALLHEVYRTVPMLQAAPEEMLDFHMALPEDRAHPHENESSIPPLPRLSKTKIKNLKALVKRRLEEKRQAKEPCPPDPAPRYDEVFAKGQEWLDSLAGESVQPSRGVLYFADTVWKSPARREPEIP